MHGLRPEYQDRVNFVILDFDRRDDRSLAADLGVARHPAFAVLGPGHEVDQRLFGPLIEEAIREVLDEAIARHGE